ncbi:hypothetical protein [Aliikangiella maris]|uniref:Uncharacterized protein n=2 Tax=Aliikangiella maris TaxID=3162458 RepID=A0ABV2BWV2_9GAMM
MKFKLIMFFVLMGISLSSKATNYLEYSTSLNTGSILHTIGSKYPEKNICYQNCQPPPPSRWRLPPLPPQPPLYVDTWYFFNDDSTVLIKYRVNVYQQYFQPINVTATANENYAIHDIRTIRQEYKNMVSSIQDWWLQYQNTTPSGLIARAQQMASAQSSTECGSGDERVDSVFDYFSKSATRSAIRNAVVNNALSRKKFFNSTFSSLKTTINVYGVSLSADWVVQGAGIELFFPDGKLDMRLKLSGHTYNAYVSLSTSIGPDGIILDEFFQNVGAADQNEFKVDVKPGLNFVNICAEEEFKDVLRAYNISFDYKFAENYPKTPSGNPIAGYTGFICNYSSGFGAPVIYRLETKAFYNPSTGKYVFVKVPNTIPVLPYQPPGCG